MGKKDDAFVLKERGVVTTTIQGGGYNPGRLIYEDDNIEIFSGDYNSLNITFKTEYEAPITISGELAIPKNGILYLDNVDVGSGPFRVFGTYQNLSNGTIRAAGLDGAGTPVIMNIDSDTLTLVVAS